MYTVFMRLDSIMHSTHAVRLDLPVTVSSFVADFFRLCSLHEAKFT